MMTILKTILLISSLLTLSSTNPVKMSFLILMFSMMIFNLMFTMGGTMWFPSIFFLLFMGGILIMFLILSSLMPNEKSFKSSTSKIFMMLLPLTLISFLYMQSLTTLDAGLTWGMQSNSNMEMMIILILGYFFGFILMISNEKMSLRSML